MALSTLMRRESGNPWFREFTDLQNAFDNLVGTVAPYTLAPYTMERPMWIPPAESYVENGVLHVRLAVPDLDVKNVSIETQGNQLRIAATMPQEKKVTERNYLRREFSVEGFERSFTLPDGVKTDAVSASYDKGVLEITAPVTDKAMPHKVEIKHTESKKLAA